MRLLCLDVGNTNVSVALFEDGARIADFRLRTDPSRPADEYAALLGQLISLHVPGPPSEALAAGVDAVAIASVVPAVTAILERVCADYVGAAPFVVSAETDTGLTIGYDPPSSLGADRLVNAYAARKLYAEAARVACIVADFGTATKIEAVSAGGVYRGGAILPGVGISMDALFNRAALLRQIPLSPAPTRAIGANTADALRSGILLGFALQADGLVRRFRHELGDAEVRVIATGGYAPLIAPHAESVETIDVHLTTTGLRLLYERAVISSAAANSVSAGSAVNAPSAP